jgi:hypothetical protein
VWRARPELNVDRLAFGEQVEQLRRKLDEEKSGQWPYEGAAQRFAIEATLKQRGLLRGELGGWC